MSRYVVAVKREYRSSGVSAESVREVPGVEVKGSSNPQRLVIEATPKAISEVTKRFGDKLIVERELARERL